VTACGHSDNRRGLSTSASGVVVVGGGVSGCACASSLACLGAKVVVLSSALDSVSQPSLGPDLVPFGADARELWTVMDSLAPSLRKAWVAAATKGQNERTGIAIDRRVLSIEAKRGLVAIPGLELRQGLVVSVATGGRGSEESPSAARRAPRGRHLQPLIVETAFGEIIEGNAVVLAVGLALGGLVHTGDEVREGGRYGETPAPGLRESIERLGAEWRRVGTGVGARYRGQDFHRSRSSQICRGMALEAMDEDAGFWPVDFPPAPHWDERLRQRDFAWLLDDGADNESYAGRASNRDFTGAGRALWPDGTATGEMYAMPGLRISLRESEGAIPIRPEQWITGLAVENVGRRGRLGGDEADLPPVWIVGRAAGARNYLESLASGGCAAGEIAAWLAKGLQGSGRPGGGSGEQSE
jgi:hypothetical protein